MIFFFLRGEDLEEIVYYPCSLEIDRAPKQRKEIEYVNFKNRTKIEENVLSFLEIRAKSDEVPLFS